MRLVVVMVAIVSIASDWGQLKLCVLSSGSLCQNVFSHQIFEQLSARYVGRDNFKKRLTLVASVSIGSQHNQDYSGPLSGKCMTKLLYYWMSEIWPRSLELIWHAYIFKFKEVLHVLGSTTG